MLNMIQYCLVIIDYILTSSRLSFKANRLFEFINCFCPSLVWCFLHMGTRCPVGISKSEFDKNTHLGQILRTENCLPCLIEFKLIHFLFPNCRKLFPDLRHLCIRLKCNYRGIHRLKYSSINLLRI